MLRHFGAVPASVQPAVDPRSAPLVLVIVLATSLVGTVIATLRTSRIRPAVALTEVASGWSRPHPARTIAGLVLVTGGVVLSTVLAGLAPSQASDAGVFVMLAECVGIGLLGPLVLGTVTRWLRPLTAGLVRVAVDDLQTMSVQFSSALIPTVLAATFAGVKIAAHTSAGTGVGPADPLWVDVSGTSIYVAFAGIAALTSFITVMVSRSGVLAAMQLAGASRAAVAGIAALEAFLVTSIAATLAATVTGVTLVPVLHQGAGTWLPSLPMPVFVLWAFGVAALVGCGMVVPTVRLVMRPAIRIAMITE